MPRCHGATPWSVRKCADPQPDPKPSVPNSQLIMLICTATCHAAMQPYWIGTLWASRNCKKCSWMWLPSASVSKAQTSASTSAAPISTHLGVLPNSVLQIIWCLETKQVLTATWHMSHMRYRVKCKHSPLAWKLLEHIRELSQEKQLQTQEIQLEIREKRVEYHENIRHRNSESKSQKKSSRFLISADFLHRFLYFRPGLGAEVQGLRSVGALWGTTGHTSNMRNGISMGYVGIHWDHIRDGDIMIYNDIYI